MTAFIELHWQTSVALSCYHAALAVIRGQPLTNKDLADALGEPARLLQAWILEEHISSQVFWSHLIPLAGGIPGNRELAEVTLTKTIGRARAEPRASFLSGLLADVRNAHASFLPHLHQQLPGLIEPLRGQWLHHGQGVLGGVLARTDAGFLVETANVVVVHPVLSGSGDAHSRYDIAHIEGLAEDPIADLPEVVRLGWLLAQLNLNLPRYCETIRPDHFKAATSLAMVPVILAAAEDIQLTTCDASIIRRAVDAWLPALENCEQCIEALPAWWETYTDMKPGWSVALQGLDRLLN